MLATKVTVVVTVPMEESSVTFLNGPTVAILKMHIPRADYSMGIRTIAAAGDFAHMCGPLMIAARGLATQGSEGKQGARKEQLQRAGEERE